MRAQESDYRAVESEATDDFGSVLDDIQRNPNTIYVDTLGSGDRSGTSRAAAR